ncbi:MAG: AsmA family protein [Desulfovibrio sp.]|uniref:AsmA family protein n=1 Tax=Desulfovibrio sp. TaxID=885 RepID=UPI00135DBC81|nr:AsmA family protein [Desulfovibrio sp.]MTJ92017.1 AsmA family protein [Desulfovibrio sp.]
MKRIFIWILGGIALLAIAAVVLISRVDTDFVVRQIADATAKATGQPLQFDTPPGISFFPPGVHFGQAHWGNADEAQGMAIAVKSGMAQLELSPLLTGNVVVREIRLDSPVVEIRESKSVAPAEAAPEPPKADTTKPSTAKSGASKPSAAKSGAPKTDAPQANATATTDQPAPAAKPATEPATLPIELKRLVLRQGSVTYTDAAGQILRIKDVNLSVENLRIGQEATVQCDFSFALGGKQANAATEASNLSGTMAFTSRLRYSPPQLLFRQTALTVTPLTGALPKEAGPLQLTCEGMLRLTDMHLQLTRALLSTPQARMTMSGEAALNAPTFNGTLEIEGSPQKLAALAGHKIKTAPSKDELRFRTILRYVPNAMNLSQMQLQVDDITLRGGLRFEFPADAPLGITADVQAGAINLTPYLPAEETHAAGSKAQDAKATSSEADAARAKKAAKPDAEAAQKMPTLDIRAKIAAISKGGLQIKDIVLAIKGEKGRYSLNSLTAGIGSGGSIKATGSMNMTNETCAIKALVADVDLGPLLVALGKTRTVDGIGMLDTELTMDCGGAAEARQSLTGRGLVEIRQLHVPAMAELGKSLPMLASKGGPLPDRFDLARAPFTAKNGEINAAPITVTSSSLNAAGKAHISLPRQNIEANMDIKTLGLTIPVTAKGPLSDISYGVDPKFALDMAKTLPGSLLNTGKQAGGATKDAAKGAEGLLRGIIGR